MQKEKLRIEHLDHVVRFIEEFTSGYVFILEYGNDRTDDLNQSEFLSSIAITVIADFGTFSTTVTCDLPISGAILINSELRNRNLKLVERSTCVDRII